MLAEEHDHRTLGQQLKLFTISDDVGSGLPIWLPNGTIIRMELENWLQNELIKRGYQPVITPHIGKLDLWRTSGHYPYYEQRTFPIMENTTDDANGYMLKPMNCPFHIQIYKSQQRSYRELPVRFNEFGTVYRFEQSGELNGLLRARGFTQDDAHIFCATSQLETEIESCIDLTHHCLKILKLDNYRVRVGLRDPDNNKYTGTPENWDLAEANIHNVINRLGIQYIDEPGEAAFYGPKIDFVVKDCMNREWQLGTIQVDYNLPQRFKLEYIGNDNTHHCPVMIHRAPLGSPERLIGILIEHYAGAFPLWLSPIQVSVLPISNTHDDYAIRIVNELRDNGLRVEFDNSPEKIGAKIRKAIINKIPYITIVGKEEQQSNTISIRKRACTGTHKTTTHEFISILRDEISSKN